ncbi:ABC transporter permease [Corallincola holothuriorum]|uniref:ABC transporter permease n=1 Tax=Corallincola holothuriorum TaxID=2282215 RepID=UPI0018F1CBA8|nr:iron ABC transporter permease [Corallincola holothuriorum]
MLRLRANRLTSIALLVALLLATPILVVLVQSTLGTEEVWRHLWDTVLFDYVSNSLWLVVGVGVCVLLLGVPAAWLVACCEFPFRRLLTVLLLLPMAMPAYIIAYTYTGIFDFAGPVQTLLRDLSGLGYGEYWFFEIRSRPGAIMMLALVLYPYVFLMSRAAFISQPGNILDASRSLGLSPIQGFFKVALPMARPAIVAGLSLALMETLADYGTVEYFGIATFTTGIFRTFYGFGDTAAAAQLAMLLLSFVLVLLVTEKYSRRKIIYFSAAEHTTSNNRHELRGGWGALATLACAIPSLFGFVLPAAMLLYWSLGSEELASAAFLTIAWNSFSLAGMAALISVLLALIMAYALRIHKNTVTRAAVQFVSMGYALPGTIIAIGVLVALTWVDHQLVARVETALNHAGADIDFGLLFSGTLVALLFAYTVRFLAISLGAVQSGLQAIKPSLDQSARTLGHTPVQVLKKVHLPLLKGSVLTALLIVFVDVLKELPATLMLRPFNFNTLAVRAYELASDERLVDAAPASLMIVLVGLLPVLLLNRSIAKSH